jgi:hypothetical protein
MRPGSGTDLARERDAVAAMTVLDRFEIAVITSISAWDSGGMRRWSPSPLGGAESHAGICRQGTAGEKLGNITEPHVLIETYPNLTARITQSGSRVGTALPPIRSRSVSLPLEE